MMKVKAKVTMFKNKGSAYEKEVFTKEKLYKYWNEDSTFNNKQVSPNEANVEFFNEEDFNKCFKIIVD